MIKVGIIGSGDVGQVLGKAFIDKGYEVKIGSRTPTSDKLMKWKKSVGNNGSTGTFSESAKFGEIIILAVLGKKMEQVLDLAEIKNFENKIIIDVTNPLEFTNSMLPTLFMGATNSLAEQLQSRIPTSYVVKALNHVPNSLMINPKLRGEKPTALICGNDSKSKKIVTEILRDFGWDDIIDIGDITSARYQETIVAIWIRISSAIGSYNHAFKLLRG